MDWIHGRRAFSEFDVYPETTLTPASLDSSTSRTFIGQMFTTSSSQKGSGLHPRLCIPHSSLPNL